MLIKLDTKVSDKNIDKIVGELYASLHQRHRTSYFFDFSDVEYIGNQELLIFTSIFQIFYQSNIPFKVSFFKNGVSPFDSSERIQKQVIQIWDVWKIWQTVDQSDYVRIYGVEDNIIQRLKRKLNYYPKAGEIYSRNEVTPYFSLPFYHNYRPEDIQEVIDKVYKLNKATEEILKAAGCSHPFTSKLLSNIITAELYTNFLDHSNRSSIPGAVNMAFMSISFRPAMGDQNDFAKVQRTKKLNFETEAIPEMKEFFFNSKKGIFKNQPYIEFSFLDFGAGIVHTLKDEFQKNISRIEEKDILYYAFQHDSSRHPLKEKIIPRGLFDAIIIVKRYSGLLVARSNDSCVIFDFSNTNSIQSAFKKVKYAGHYFPGSLISIYLPAVKNQDLLDNTSIRPEFEFKKVSFGQKRYLNLSKITEYLNGKKLDLYDNVLREIKRIIKKETATTLFFFNFSGHELIQRRVVRKILYFLLSDYAINYQINFIILNPPPPAFIKEFANELMQLNSAIKNYKIHPLPLVSISADRQDLHLEWLGVYSEKDKQKLNDLLFDDFLLTRRELLDPNNASGHLNFFDKHGNVLTNFPGRTQLLKVFNEADSIGATFEIERLLDKYQAIHRDDNNLLYLCSGNYYQKEYVELSNLINDRTDCNLICHFLFRQLSAAIDNFEDCVFIGITSSSGKILKSLIRLNKIKAESTLFIDNYENVEAELTPDLISNEKQYYLICDVLSTGRLCKRVDSLLKSAGTKLNGIAVLINILSDAFPATAQFKASFSGKIISLYDFEINKFYKDQIEEDIQNRDLIRVNPHTALPVLISIEQTRYFDTVLYHSESSYDMPSQRITLKNEFLDRIDEDAVTIGFRKFNSVIHPYFFETKTILKQLSLLDLRAVFEKINLSQLQTEKIQIFYPRGSSIEGFNFKLLKDALNNHAIEEIEIERFSTTEGWKFPHNSTYLSSKIEDNICMILDDGSCSGDSLIQMIDEIAFYQTREIVLICFIGRVSDHKREFFSRMAEIKVKNGHTVPLTVYFVSHWHIPTYYIDDNPNSKELDWLEDVLELQNVPQQIIELADKIRKSIIPKDSKSFLDYQYLPKIKDADKAKRKIPKKDILLVREEVGKIIGYRLYRESFSFFNNFIKKYHRIYASANRYKEIELLCATFVYEPYLYDRIAVIMPDVAERIETFIKLVISDKHLFYDLLTYTWNKKDIIHLFFIAFKGQRLLEELTIEMFQKLLEFSNNKSRTLNYILYKLLLYFPLKYSQVEEKPFAPEILELIEAMINSGIGQTKDLKKFFNFISTLPVGKDFYSQLNGIRLSYERELSPALHIDKVSFNHIISLIIANMRTCIKIIEDAGELHETKIKEIQNAWFNIISFVKPIMTFTISFNGFLKPYPYFILLNEFEASVEVSLRTMVGYNDEVIISLDIHFTDTARLKQAVRNMMSIQGQVEIGSYFSTLVRTPFTKIKKLIPAILEQIGLYHTNIAKSGIDEFSEHWSVNIPEPYSDLLIIKEIGVNVRNHANKGSPLKFSVVLTNSILVIHIENEINPDPYKNSNGEGLKCLGWLSDFSPFEFQYKSKEDHTTFLQTLTFQVNEH